jgi:hypothetical protein
MVRRFPVVVSAALLALLCGTAQASPGFVWGVKVGAGGRYDDVRMCVASSPGVKGGPVAELYLFTEVGRVGNVSATLNLPVMRPVLFGVAFKMLQLEPDVSIDIYHALSDSLDLVYGPRVGLSFHYGPDYRSGTKDAERGPDFFAVGPKLGISLALQFKRPGGVDYLVGINPYFIPLIAVDDPSFPDGIVVGGMLEGAMRWGD